MINADCSPLKAPLIFDSHSHYDDEGFDEIRDCLLNELPNNGVCGIVTCGCDKASCQKAISLAEKYDYIYAAVGIHPDNISTGTTVQDIRLLAESKNVVAIGEIGLDYFHNAENKTEQIKLFEEQILLAKELDLPVIVHDREAHADTLEILKKHKPKGVLHCFSGSVEMAAEILKLGMYIGIGGVITFKNAKKLPDVVKILPMDRMLLETDCPYLAPEPFRGKLCHSAMIYYTAEKIAEIKDIFLNEILEKTAENSKKLFGL